MIKRNLPLLLKVLFVLLFAALVVWHKRHSARILVIHSYHADYSWVKEENEGFQRFFGKHPEVQVHWHYMDLKNHQDQDFQRAAASLANKAIQRWQPDVLVLFDDIAQELVGSRYVGDPHLKLVFGGVNAAPEKYHYVGARNVTGVLERKPLRAIDDTLKMLWKENGDPARLPRVVLIGDRSFDFAAGLAEYAAEHYAWRDCVWLEPLVADTFEDWKQLVRRAATAADFILVSDYRQLRGAGGKQFVGAAEVMGWTERNAKIPVLGMTTAATQDGAMMGVAAAGHEQGLVAAQQAYAVVNGTPASQLPIVTGQQSLISIRRSALARRGFEPPSVYEAFARAIDLHYD